MIPMQPKYAYTHGVKLYEIRIPKGAVYIRLITTKKQPICYAWVIDVPLARKNKNGFYVYTLTRDDQYPRKKYVDATKGYARIIKAFIDSLPESQIINCKPEIYQRDFSGLAPKEPTGGQHFKPSKGYKCYLQGVLRAKK